MTKLGLLLTVLEVQRSWERQMNRSFIVAVLITLMCLTIILVAAWLIR